MAQKKYNLEILAPARDEILEIARLHLELVGPESARRITAKIKDSLEHLRTHPHMGILLRDKVLQAEGYRMLVCGNYLCIYKPLGDTVCVYHIAHGRSNYPRLFSDLQKTSSEHPLDVSALTGAELNAELEKGCADIEKGNVRPAGEAFLSLRGELGLKKEKE